MSVGMGDLSEHFDRREMACRHCGLCVLHPALVPALEQLRAQGEEPVIVHDACRCQVHNAAVGGVKNSEHPRGEAADVGIPGLTLQEMYDRAKLVPAFAQGGIGVYDTVIPMIHVDVRTQQARWSRVKGEYKGISELVIP